MFIYSAERSYNNDYFKFQIILLLSETNIICQLHPNKGKMYSKSIIKLVHLHLYSENKEYELV